MKYQVIGHSYLRTYYLCGREGTSERKTYDLPGGASMLSKLLNGIDSENCALVLPEKDIYRHEFFEISEYIKKGFRYLAVSRALGMNAGETAAPFTEGDAVVVWDAGFGSIDLSTARDKPVFWASEIAIPEKDTFLSITANCFLMLSAKALRDAGAMISKAVSWERTAMNLLWQLRNNDRISYLLKAPHILVIFAEDGAVHIQTESGVIRSAVLALTNGKPEGSLRSQNKGLIHDAFYVMAATAALQFPDMIGGKPLIIAPILESGKKLIDSGYQPESLETCGFEIVKQVPDENIWIEIPVIPGGDTALPDNWLIADQGSIEKTITQAMDYVLCGKSAIKGLPILEIGGLKTVDRWEIEAFGNINNMIFEYSRNDDEQPLSIAVFGKPGSGKSFGIKQIAQNLLSRDELGSETFNISQLVSTADLGAAFQRVRDIRMQGKLPLVFFDEFDAAGPDGKPLGWLKYFLAPMQDGEFYDASGKNRLGKCIMVFAGGTASFLREFQKFEDAALFRAQKGPDFVSRIKGSIDIAGPNPRSSSEKSYILRRALLLRSFCERHPLLDAKHNNDFIDENIIRAMLLVPTYKYGARSMETILKQSRISGRKWLPAALPLEDQLTAHVNVRAFTDLLLLPVIENSTEGIIARAIHENYVKNLTSKGLSRANVKPWDALSPHYKLSNFIQARSFPEKLALIGCEMLPKDPGRQAVTAFVEDEITVMAKQEHERWCDEKREDGWEYAPVEDRDRKLSDCLIEWDRLSQRVQDWDKDPVRNMISLLDSIGFAVYRKR